MAETDLARVPEVPARLVFMGGASSEARARVIERSAAWRRSQALKDLLLLLLVPVVVFIPPHIPWVLLVIGVALFRAFNHNREYATLLSLHGPCPKCGAEQDFSELGRMGNPHKVTCAHCKWDSYVEVARASEAT
ncbi:MAG TPA: hypothetical protein VFJ82_07075 [Longimicrobium sp.]|nr:hypothetical protein [Longimicrobium sp.]